MSGLHHHDNRGPNKFSGSHDHDGHTHLFMWFIILLLVLERSG